MPRPRRRLIVRDVVARGVRRGLLGPLQHQKVSAKALEKYHDAVKDFYFWWVSIGQPNISAEATLDVAVQDYIELMWDSNVGVHAAQTTVAGVQYVLRHSARLRGSWK